MSEARQHRLLRSSRLLLAENSVHNLTGLWILWILKVKNLEDSLIPF